MDPMDGLVDRSPREGPQAFWLDDSQHQAKVTVASQIAKSGARSPSGQSSWSHALCRR